MILGLSTHAVSVEKIGMEGGGGGGLEQHPRVFFWITFLRVKQNNKILPIPALINNK